MKAERASGPVNTFAPFGAGSFYPDNCRSDFVGGQYFYVAAERETSN